MKLSFQPVKRIFQFRLRTFLVFVFAAGLFCAWIANAKIQRDRELAVIDQFLTASTKAPYEVIRQTVSPGSNGGVPTPGLILLWGPGNGKIIVDYRGPELLRSLAEEYNLSIFDRVTGIEFHRGTVVSDFDLTVFRDLEKVSKPIERVQIETAHLSKLDARAKFAEEMEQHIQLQVESALNHSFSDCQIANVEQFGSNWQAEIKPELISCNCGPTGQ